MVTFNVNLSPESFTKLAQDLQNYTNKLIQAEPDILQALADYVYERIMFYVPVDTGQLKASFMKEVSQNVARVYTDLYYAKYVEFGTGIRGSNSEYDSKYVSELNYSPTYAGQPARKFIYQAVLDLERDYEEIVLNVLRKKGLI